MELENQSLRVTSFNKSSSLPLVLLYGCVAGLSYEHCITLTDPNLSSFCLNGTDEAITGIGYIALSFSPGHANISWTQRLLAKRN